VEQYQAALQLQGDPKRGKSIFVQTCATCHKRGDEGKEIGPNLKTVTQHSPEKLLANILDPSRDIQPGYHAYQCSLTDGTEIFGLITTETGNSITMQTGRRFHHTF
jgi:putative heme-binding domain-containing protein